jgi:hypothetical protein
VHISLPSGAVPWNTKFFAQGYLSKRPKERSLQKKTPEIVVVLKGKKKVDVNLSLSLIKHHAMETWEEVET